MRERVKGKLLGGCCHCPSEKSTRKNISIEDGKECPDLAPNSELQTQNKLLDGIIKCQGK